VTPRPIALWLDFIERGHLEILDELLADDSAFYSPAVFAAQEGKSTVKRYLSAAERLFHDSDFHYVKQWVDQRSAVLQFAAELDGTHVEGIDIIEWNDENKITSFKVMIRPLSALEVVIPKMGQILAAADC
jgi:hypothetical protein